MKFNNKYKKSIDTTNISKNIDLDIEIPNCQRDEKEVINMHVRIYIYIYIILHIDYFYFFSNISSHINYNNRIIIASLTKNYGIS